MVAPRAGWLSATASSLALLLLLGACAGRTTFDTLSIDLKHRWVAVTAARDGLLAAGEAVSGASPAPLGVNVFLEQEVDPEKRQRSLELLRAANVSWIRQQLPWEQIEPVAKGHYEDPKFGGTTWAKFDDIVTRANQVGIDVVFRLDTSPSWALRSTALDGLGPPVRSDDYWDFVQAVAERYRGRVLAYQVWNEPNLSIEWGRQAPDPVGYARLLRGAADRIRQADPRAQVVMAALAPTLTDNDQAENELLYLQALYDAGVRGTFDVLAVQAYGLRGGPDDPRLNRSDVTFSRPELVRQVMARNGDSATPMWATEVGWNVNPPETVEQRFGRVTPMLQARYTIRAFERARHAWPWLERLCVWYWKRPDWTNAAEDWYWFRLADPDFQLQPVYLAIRDFLAAR